MPRTTRLIIPNIFHHAVQRGNNRQDVFQERVDRFYYLKWARKLAKQYHVSIIGYCLMTNHTHFLALPGTQEGMINLIKLLAQRYTRYYNRKYRRSSKLWENRYKLRPFDPAVYYVVLRYIERNPVRAGMVADGARYPRSSGSYHFLGREDMEATQQGKAWEGGVISGKVGQ